MSIIHIQSNAPFEQNNIPEVINLSSVSFADYTSNLELAILNKANTLGIDITETSIPILAVTINIDNTTKTKVQKYQLNLGKGYYGTGLDSFAFPRTPITLDKLILIYDSGNSENLFTGQDNISKTIVVTLNNLSGIGTIKEQIAEYINSLNYIKEETFSDIWILTDEEEETSLELHYSPVNRVADVGTSYTILDTDDKKFITINNTINIIEIANNLPDGFDCYLLNSNITNVAIGITVATVINEKYNKVILNGGVIRIRKNASGLISITGDLELDFAKSNVQIETASNVTSLTLNNAHHGKDVIINASTSNINVFVPSTLKTGFKANFIQVGSNLVTFIAQVGVSLVSKSGLSITGQYSKCEIYKRNSLTNTFILTGEIKL